MNPLVLLAAVSLLCVVSTTTAQQPYYTTSFGADGNKYVGSCGTNVAGNGRVMTVMADTRTLVAPAKWIVGTDQGNDYMIMNSNGELSLIEPSSPTVFTITILPTMSPIRPLVGYLVNGILTPVPQPAAASNSSSAVPLPDGSTLYISSDRRLRQINASGIDFEPLALGNFFRPAADSFITATTMQQGDVTEMLYAMLGSQIGLDGTFTLADPSHVIKVARFDSSNNTLDFEGLSVSQTSLVDNVVPIWGDVNGDGVDDILTTHATEAGIFLHVEIGKIEPAPVSFTIDFSATSETLSSKSDWTHQLALGPLGLNGETEIVAVVDPYDPSAGGSVVYLRFNAARRRLEKVAEIKGYTTHNQGSDNIDMATVGDFNGDGIPETVVVVKAGVLAQGSDTVRSVDTLVALQRCSQHGIGEVWSVPLSSPLSSNLGVTCDPSTGEFTIQYGTDNNGFSAVRFAVDSNAPATMVSKCVECPKCTAPSSSSQPSLQRLSGLLSFTITMVSLRLGQY